MGSTASVRRGGVVLLAGILLVGAALRWGEATAGGFWVDKAQALEVMGLPTVGETIAFLAQHESHPPVYYVLMRGWTKSDFRVRYCLDRDDRRGRDMDTVIIKRTTQRVRQTLDLGGSVWRFATDIPAALRAPSLELERVMTDAVGPPPVRWPVHTGMGRGSQVARVETMRHHRATPVVCHRRVS